METCWLKITRRKQLTIFVFFLINQKYNLCLTSKLMFFKLKRIVYPSHHNFRHTAMYACFKNTALDYSWSV